VRPILSLIGAGALVALVAFPAAAAHGGEPTLVVMQHLCGPEIQSEADFVAVENEGAGGQAGGEGTLPGLVATVLACPTVFLPSDTGTGGIAADPTEFAYTVADGDGATYELGADSMFMAAELCESAIALDANGNGEVEDDVCLDVSMYEFAPVAEGGVTVTQTTAPGDTRFGTVRFTPASTDELALVTAGATMQLDTTADTQVDDPPLPLAEYNDDVIVAHVYNFQNASGEVTAEGGMPNAATEAPASSTLQMLLLVVGSLIAVAGATILATRRQRF
jgi:hypothetical protein